MTGKAYYEQAQVQQKKPKGSWVLTKMSQYYLRWVHVPNIIEVASNLLRWPTTVTSNTNCSNQIKNCSHQKQNPNIKNKLLTSKTNYSHQIPITHIKNKLLKLNGQQSENENYVQFSLGFDPTVILFLHMVPLLSSGCFVATAEEMSTIALFATTAGKVS